MRLRNNSGKERNRVASIKCRRLKSSKQAIKLNELQNLENLNTHLKYKKNVLLLQINALKKYFTENDIPY